MAATLAATMLLAAGCAAPGPARGYLTREFGEISTDTAYATAQAVLREQFRRVTPNRERMELVSQPVEYRTSAESGTSRDLYRGASLMRRTAHCSVAERGGGAAVRLRIDVERQDTRRAEVTRSDENRMGDAPGYTPIERDAATTYEQNTVWTFVRRDLRLERELMSAIETRLAPTAATSASAPVESPSE